MPIDKAPYRSVVFLKFIAPLRMPGLSRCLDAPGARRLLGPRIVRAPLHDARAS
jgi:hypothetical protein